jgi:hypothetical protein
MRTGHLSVTQGKRVIVWLRDGSRLVDHFVAKRTNYVELRAHGRVNCALIRTISIYKGNTSMWS